MVKRRLCMMARLLYQYSQHGVSFLQVWDILCLVKEINTLSRLCKQERHENWKWCAFFEGPFNTLDGLPSHPGWCSDSDTPDCYVVKSGSNLAERQTIHQNILWNSSVEFTRRWQPNQKFSETVVNCLTCKKIWSNSSCSVMNLFKHKLLRSRIIL